MGITPSSRYHPDNMAKRAAQEAAAPGKPAPLTTSDLAELARAEEKRASAARLDAETEARRVAPPQPFDAAGKKAQWDAAIKAERTLYLKEFTVQAHERPWPVWPSTKPTLMPSRCCWAVRSGRKRASASKPRCGQRPRMAKPAGWPLSVHRTGKKAVQKAVERRVGEKNPELMGDMPKVLAALLEARKQADALAREQQSQGPDSAARPAA